MGYYQFVKAYSNYYVPNEADENLQFGVSFTIPSYSAFIFDISKDSEKINYQVSYSPYSVLSLKILHRDFSANEAIDDTVLQVGFSFKFNESFVKQLRKRIMSCKKLIVMTSCKGCVNAYQHCGIFLDYLERSGIFSQSICLSHIATIKAATEFPQRFPTALISDINLSTPKRTPIAATGKTCAKVAFASEISILPKAARVLPRTINPDPVTPTAPFEAIIKTIRILIS